SRPGGYPMFGVQPSGCSATDTLLPCRLGRAGKISKLSVELNVGCWMLNNFGPWTSPPLRPPPATFARPPKASITPPLRDFNTPFPETLDFGLWTSPHPTTSGNLRTPSGNLHHSLSRLPLIANSLQITLPRLNLPS